MPRSKRVVDVALAVGCAVVLAPVTIATAVTVRIKLGSQVIYRQRRVGLGGRSFTVYKFRTMRPDRRDQSLSFVGPDRRVNHKDDDDPRHTPVGRFLRQTRLDELPQLWNVIKGDMSLVGPRPEIVEIVERYEPWQHGRHVVRPGLTGAWQVSDSGHGVMHEHVDIDLAYIEGLSLKSDAAILARTFGVIMARSGR